MCAEVVDERHPVAHTQLYQISAIINHTYCMVFTTRKTGKVGHRHGICTDERHPVVHTQLKQLYQNQVQVQILNILRETRLWPN